MQMKPELEEYLVAFLYIQTILNLKSQCSHPRLDESDITKVIVDDGISPKAKACWIPSGPFLLRRTLLR